MIDQIAGFIRFNISAVVGVTVRIISLDLEHLIICSRFYSQRKRRMTEYIAIDLRGGRVHRYGSGRSRVSLRRKMERNETLVCVMAVKTALLAA